MIPNLPSADVSRFRFNGSAFASQPDPYKSRHPEVALTIECFWRGASGLLPRRRPASFGFADVVAALALRLRTESRGRSPGYGARGTAPESRSSAPRPSPRQAWLAPVSCLASASKALRPRQRPCCPGPATQSRTRRRTAPLSPYHRRCPNLRTPAGPPSCRRLSRLWRSAGASLALRCPRNSAFLQCKGFPPLALALNG